MKTNKLIIHFLLLFAIFQKSNANSFEGNLTIIKETFYDTTFYYLSVQNNLVRIDQKNSQKQIIQSLIVDIKEEKITALSPNHKLYTQIDTKRRNPNNKNEIVVIPSQNYKIINGYKCFLWRVRNESMNSEVSYWVYNSGYEFFHKTVQLLNGTEDYSNLYNTFSQIDNVNGLPILSIERTLLREEKVKITITHLSNKKVNPNIFHVPEGYKYLKY
jgi:hypothetical protein